LLKKHNKVTARGKRRTGFSSKYATLGVHTQRGKRGLSEKKIHECCKNDYAQVKGMLRRVEHIAKMYLPFGVLSCLGIAKTLVGDNISLNTTDGSGENNGVWASIATSFNYVSPSHVDKDAFLSCLTVSYCDEKMKGKKQLYELNQLVAVYFCFPELNIAIGLRPGDVLYFNPLHHHCVSQRTEDYKDGEIFVTSFYIKTSQISLNDNEIPISNLIVNDDE
jgi:hypothetical protein